MQVFENYPVTVLTAGQWRTLELFDVSGKWFLHQSVVDAQLQLIHIQIIIMIFSY